MICFLSFDKNGFDLNNSLPLINKLSEQDKVCIIALNNCSFEKNFGFYNYIKSLNINIIYLDQIIFNDIFKNLDNQFFLKIIKKLLFFFRNFFFKKIKKKLKKYKIIFAPSMLTNLMTNFEKKIYKIVKLSNSTFIGQQIVTTHDLYYSKIFDFDIYLCNSKNEFNSIQKISKIKSVFLGNSSLEKKNIKQLITIPENQKNKYDFILILNNFDQVLSSKISIVEEVRKFIKIFKDLRLSYLIKFHPKNNISDFEKEFEKKNIIQINELLEDSISRGKNIIFFTSNGIFKSISLEKKTYHYVPLYNKKKEFVDKLPDWAKRMYLVKKDNKYTNHFLHSMYCKEFNNSEEIKEIIQEGTSNDYQLFNDNFYTDKSTERTLDFIKNYK